MLEILRGRRFNGHINKGLSIGKTKEMLLLDFDMDVFLPTRNMNLQRPLVWTLQQKQQLILSVFKEIDIGKLSLIQVKTDTSRIYEVVDGKQRLNAILSFLKDEFPLFIENHLYTFSELPEDVRLYFSRQWITADVAYSYPDVDAAITDQEKIDWFLRINFAGTPQDLSHHQKLL